jgi:hypothetical protein
MNNQCLIVLHQKKIHKHKNLKVPPFKLFTLLQLLGREISSTEGQIITGTIK